MITMDAKIYVAGHRGMVGSAIVRRLGASGYNRILTRTHDELDLTNQAKVREFLKQEKPDFIFLAAAKAGGILANNTYRADFMYQNLMIEANLIHAAYEAGTKRLMFLGSSCAYPRDCPQPIKEEYLLTGPLEPTNEPYAIAKIAGIKLCESYNLQYGMQYFSVMPTNLFGPGDNYHPENSHVIPALIRRFHEAKMKNDASVVIWGTGTPKREFLFVDDMAAACVHVMGLDHTAYSINTRTMLSHINVGRGTDMAIRELAEAVGKAVGFTGHIEFDPTKPDGVTRKLLDVSRLHALGWEARVSLEEGLILTYQDFLSNHTSC